ncbi:diaminopimelate epimerase [Kineosporia succinea]|uniref:Diaminopimelate epimerase n=1 Tax=Kineosporia succinea TaxID=84632 RepID=A0ABT9NW17_9ACTN|nr:diaminopimelate epimerase [Kineosporia succinea]MDP9824613.1 diaminopimelate epimerase [Kineosporia succinea]
MTTFVKGHGTENDFVLLDDPEGTLDLTPELIRHLADRRAGLGADGVIRVVRSAAAGQDAAGEWFMDYWNSDGSAAEMCGNGSRVFVAHLLRRGWITLGDGDEVAITTRGGVLPVSRRGDLFSIDLGAWQVAGGPAAVTAGGDVTVTFPGMPPLPGLSVALSNPHVVVVLPDVATLEALDLTVPPVVEPAPPHGTNVEIVVPMHDQSIQNELGHLRMRVHERGSGETRSCGTGTVAAAIAARAWGGDLAPDHWRVDVPGGTLYVDAEGTSSEGDSAKLTGPAVIVAEGELVDVVVS